jgi:hypothetical protein
MSATITIRDVSGDAGGNVSDDERTIVTAVVVCADLMTCHLPAGITMNILVSVIMTLTAQFGDTQSEAWETVKLSVEAAFENKRKQEN